MKSKRNREYALREIELAKAFLAVNPENKVQKDRLAWWSACLGDFETAREYAVSKKVTDFIKECETH